MRIRFDPLEQTLAGIMRQLKCNKGFDQGRLQGHIADVPDGIEILFGYRRARSSMGGRSRVASPAPRPAILSCLRISVVPDYCRG